MKFKIGDIVKYYGNIYRIEDIRFTHSDYYLYRVECVKNNFPDEPVVLDIGKCAEDRMEHFIFNDDLEKEIYELHQSFSEIPYNDFDFIARHFFELGLNSKEEKK